MSMLRRILIMSVGLGLLAGCNYFKPADPEIPKSPPIIGDYTTVEATLQSIVQAVQAKGQSGGGTVYSGAFADPTLYNIPGFHQVFSPQDLAKWTGNVPTDWDFRSESQFYDKGTYSLIQLRPGNYQLTWEPDPINADRLGNPTLLHRRYTLVVFDEQQTVTDVIARGFADLTFQQASNGNWYITRWEDRQDPEPYSETLPNVTWGQRRLEYGQ